ncbi:MAG: hypothetical protein QME89_01925, partial [Actinomycetota bacterium]|nr:hypothetical protein [Actinomycetota bacterium]
FAAQLVGAAACTVFVFGLSYLFFRLQDRWHGIRVSPQEEVDGLDVHEMGINAYTEDSRLVLPISPVPAADMGEARVGGR